MRTVFVGFLLCAATCDAGPKNTVDNTLTTPSVTNTPTIAGVDCTEDLTAPPAAQPGLPECIVHELKCGDRFEASNVGGTELYDWGFWEDAMELGQLATEPRDILDGPEVVYAIYDQPTGADYNIDVRVQSCVQLWASWRRHGDISDDWCDVAGAQSEVGHFTGEWRDRSYTLLNRSSGLYDWEIILDSWDGQTGNYVITVDCTTDF